MTIVNPNSQAIALIRQPGQLIWADGFEAGNVYSSGIAGVTYSTANSRVSGGGYGISVDSNDNNSYVFLGGLNATEIICQITFKLSSFFQSRPIWLVSFTEGILNTNIGLGVYINGFGGISLGRKTVNANISTVYASSATSLATVGVWHTLQFKIKLNATTGYFSARLDGVDILSSTGLAIQINSLNVFSAVVLAFSDSDVFNALVMDDWVMFDNTNDYYSNWLEDLRVYDLFPSSDGTYSEWTPSTGTALWSTIDETASTGPLDTDYISSNTTGQRATFNYTDLPSNAQSIKGILYAARAEKTDAGPRKLEFMQRQGGTDYARSGSDTVLTIGYPAHIVYPEMINPATGVAWTVSDLNTNAEFGIKLT